MMTREEYEKAIQRIEEERERLDEEIQKTEEAELIKYLTGLGFSKVDDFYELIVDDTIKYRVKIDTRYYTIHDIASGGRTIHSYSGAFGYDDNRYFEYCTIKHFQEQIEKTPEIKLYSVTPPSYRVLSSSKPNSGEFVTVKTYKLGVVDFHF